MNLVQWAIDRPIHTWLLMLTFLLGGLWGLSTIGRLEDPAFTLKQAVVITPYPGADATTVEAEVTEPLESAIQQLPQLKNVISKSRPGVSEIIVEVKDHYDGTTMPQVWDELRRKVNDARLSLPGGAGPSIVNDDFGDVYGLFYSITAPGFSDAERRDIARFLRRELLTVPGVSKVALAGLPEEAIHVDIPHQRLAGLSLPVDQVLQVIQGENAIVPSGALTLGEQRVRVAAEPGFDSVATIEALRLGVPGTTDQLSLADVGSVSRGPVEVPEHVIRQDGDTAITLAVSGLLDANIVAVGEAVEAHLATLAPRLPAGVTLSPIYEQHRVVDEAINGFIINLVASVLIVVAVLCVAMGWRVGLVVGLTLLLTVLGTVLLMRLLHIEMERISLGALIIAMGMLVDNAIVIAEGMLINLQRGMKHRAAAIEAARHTQIPLLGATVIGLMAFAGIGLSNNVTGEFLFSLFAVIAMSLLLSWLLAVTATPLLGVYFFKNSENPEADPYAGATYQRYRGWLVAALGARRRTLAALTLLTLVCLGAFGFVKQAFFPPSTTPLFYVNVWLPQGSDLRTTTAHVAEIEAYLKQQPEVEAVTSFIGQGATRFMLTYAPELPNSAYAQMIVRVNDPERIDALMAAVRETQGPRHPDADIFTQRLMFGPGDPARMEVRLSGPDAAQLRAFSQQVETIFRDAGFVDIRQNWRARELTVVPQFNEARARLAGIGRSDVAQTLAFATSGLTAGVYRDGDTLIPIVLRPPAAERLDVERLQDRLIWSALAERYVPLTQVIDGLDTVPQDTVIQRRNRVRTLTVQAEPAPDQTVVEAHAAVRDAIAALDLPPGYRVEWGGEVQSAGDAQRSLGQQLPLSFLVMLVISLLLFRTLKQPLVIWLIVPMAICGVTLGLLLTNTPFTFTALLGLLSLSGMLMKNAIVLVEEIDVQLETGKPGLVAVVDASISRMRPVLLAAVTTILGMLPLIWDAFFASMAITIMAGLAFATVLTLIAVPVLYAQLLKLPVRLESQPSPPQEARP